MSEYVSFPLSATDMPIDISFAFGDEKPAGKHGFLKVEGAYFKFEDGTPGRFWGTCLNGAACFPEHDHAEKLAARLAKTGINIVRLHQMDCEAAQPNIFQYSRGQRLITTRKLDERSLDRMDYLIHCLKKEGIYIFMDLLVHRQFKEADGVRNAKALSNGARPWDLVDRTMIDLQKEYAVQLMTHVNPYTGLAYTEEPAVAMMDIINESSLFCTLPLCEPYATELRQDFRKWLDERNIDYDAENCTLFGVDKDAPLVRYKVEKEKAYFDEMYNHLKAIGVRAPICGTNYIMHAGLYESNSYQDFRDSHAYFHRIWENSMWGEFPEQKKLESFSTCWRGDSGFSKLFHMRSLDQPFFVSEWNMTWPNFYRAEGPIQHAALGCLQGFAGFAIHTYSYQARQTDDMLLGKETPADAIAGVAYREGIFSCWNDPACYGLFYHAALMTRRADVAEANRTIGIKVNAERSRERAEFLNKDLPDSQDWYLEKRFDRMAPCYYGLTEVSKVGNYIDEVPEGVDEVYEEPQWTIDTTKREVLSDNGQMYRSWEKECGWVDSDRTKCAYGFLEKNGTIELNGLSIDCRTDFGTIALSSLTDEPLDKTDNILLTTVGRAYNKDAKFEDWQMVERGTNPTQIEVIHATIKLKTDKKDMKVYSITPEGNHYGTVASTWEDGVLTFTVGEHWRSMYYLIQES